LADPAEVTRRLAFELGPTPGIERGYTYPLALDGVGMHHRLYDYLAFRIGEDDWPRRVRWLRRLGAEAVTTPEPFTAANAHLLAAAGDSSHPSLLYVLDAPAPFAWWPARVATTTGAAAAYDLLAVDDDPTGTAVAPIALRHQPGARLRVLAAEPDQVV